MPLLKRYYDVYLRRTSTKLDSTAIDTATEVGTSITDEMGTNYSSTDLWNKVGLMVASGQVGVSSGAFIRAESGDNQALADGSNPVISENLVAEFTSFDLDQRSWSDAEGSGGAASLPVRNRFSTNVTGVNVDIAYIDKELGNETVQNIYLWNVPLHIGFNVEAGAVPSLPCTVSKEVSTVDNSLDVVEASTS